MHPLLPAAAFFIATCPLACERPRPPIEPVPTCGDGVVDDGEICDGNCPSSCAAVACAVTALTGAADTCNAACVSAAITQCASGDGCCPSTSCSHADDDDCPVSCAQQRAALEDEMSAALDTAALISTITTDPNFTVVLETPAGRSYRHSHGTSTATTSYRSASTSKLVTAVVLLTLVDRGDLSLTSKPTDLFNFWIDEDAVTLRDLLSFTSGFNHECDNGVSTCLLSCVNDGNADPLGCVEQIYDDNVDPPRAAPGSDYYYSSTHMQIAGGMARVATGKTWTQLFTEFVQQTGLLANSAFDLPSAQNPRLAGGMHWTGEDYVQFLRALHLNIRPSDQQPLLSPTSRAALFANQRGEASVSFSPVALRLTEDWAYGLGTWLECRSATFDCGEGHRYSSPGAYGAYPFLDFDAEYYGIVAREGDGTGVFPEGIQIFRSIETTAAAWAALSCVD